MKSKLKNEFLAGYLLMFVLSALIMLFAFLLLDFSNHLLSTVLVKNNYTAASLIKDDYEDIDTSEVISRGGGVLVIGKDFKVLRSEGVAVIDAPQLTVAEFTEFLVSSQAVERTFSYDIAYNEASDYWLVVSFPTSIRLDFAISQNRQYVSQDMPEVAGVFVSVGIFYLLLLGMLAFLYSRYMSLTITRPLRALRDGVLFVRNGDYSARVELKLKNEFADLQDAFNDMAAQIEKEIAMRKRSEESRKNLILGISHDLKNPLASVVGYAETLMQKGDVSMPDRLAYAGIIHENGLRANELITDLFELSRLESPEFVLQRSAADLCEYLRVAISRFIPQIEASGFGYDVDIPEAQINVMLDYRQMDRVVQNLITNALRHNPPGTRIAVSVFEDGENALVTFSDDGTGISDEQRDTVFLPFVAAHSQGGSGLGLAIASRIITAHGGKLSLDTKAEQGCTFKLVLPKI